MRKKKCYFCEKGLNPDYKKPEQLKEFLWNESTIKPARITGTCGKHQRKIQQAVERARHLALLPFHPEELRNDEANP